MVNLTREFADLLVALSARGLDATATEAALELLIDGVSVAALGSIEPGPGIFANLARDTGASPIGTMIGHTGRVAAVDAARVNGASMHVLDFEPMWNPANHALSTTLPAVIAASEMILRKHPSVPKSAPPPTGRSILTALAIGIETQARLRRSSSQFEPGQLVFHPPGTVGPLGSAIACGLLFGLNADALTYALGIGASRAGAIQANIGSMTKALHCGQAAASGLDAALLAGHGFTADADALNGPRGYGRAFFGEGFVPEKLTERIDTLHIVEPGPAFKFYPSQYGTHFVITAALEARSKLPPGAKIARVRVVSPSMPYMDRPAPPTGLAGKFSFQYTAAAALLDGAVRVSTFKDERRFAPDMVGLLERMVFEVDAAREGRFDRLRIDIYVETEDGQSIHGHCAGPPGIWGRRADRALLVNKARDCLSAVMPADAAQSLLDRSRRMTEFEASDLLSYFDRLSLQP